MSSVSKKQQQITTCLSARILIRTAARHDKIHGVATGLFVAPAFIWSADVMLPQQNTTRSHLNSYVNLQHVHNSLSPTNRAASLITVAPELRITKIPPKPYPAE